MDTMIVGPDTLANLPQVTSMSLTTTGFAGRWGDMRVVKAPRVYRGGFLRTVFEDSRWKLRHTVMAENFNKRTSLGGLHTGSAKSISQLVSEIASASGLTINTGTLPSWKPRAAWTGKRAIECLHDLLEIAGCRIVYDPTSEEYTVSQAGTGDMPDITERLLRPGPKPHFNTLSVQSAPVLYEDRMSAQAMEVDSVGDMTAFFTTPKIPTDGDRVTQPDLRVWQPTSITHPEALGTSRIVLNPHRAASLVADSENPAMLAARVFPDAWDAWPHYLPAVSQDSITRKITTGSGGEAVFFEHAVLCGDGTGGFQTTGDLLTSYYVRETDGTLRRNEETRSIDGTADKTLAKVVDWVTPVDSTESDMAGPAWSTLLSNIADTLQAKHQAETQTVSLIRPVGLGGSGHVGRVNYVYDIRRPRRLRFEVAFNFDPGSRRKMLT